MWLRIAEEWEKLAENSDGNQGPQFAEQPGAVREKVLFQKVEDNDATNRSPRSRSAA